MIRHAQSLSRFFVWRNEFKSKWFRQWFQLLRRKTENQLNFSVVKPIVLLSLFSFCAPKAMFDVCFKCCWNQNGVNCRLICICNPLQFRVFHRSCVVIFNIFWQSKNHWHQKWHRAYLITRKQILDMNIRVGEVEKSIHHLYACERQQQLVRSINRCFISWEHLDGANIEFIAVRASERASIAPKKKSRDPNIDSYLNLSMIWWAYISMRTNGWTDGRSVSRLPGMYRHRNSWAAWTKWCNRTKISVFSISIKHDDIRYGRRHFS